jgi:hypothetical protein
MPNVIVLPNVTSSFALFGTGFINIFGPMCKFGNTTTNGTYISAYQVNCAAPSQAMSVGTVNVTVSNEGSYFSNAVSFTGACLSSCAAFLSVSHRCGMQ